MIKERNIKANDIYKYHFTKDKRKKHKLMVDQVIMLPLCHVFLNQHQ